MTAEIACYVPRHEVKGSYAKDCFDTRMYSGLMVAKDILERAGYEVDLAGAPSLGRYRLVLASLTSDCDVWQYIRERQSWPSGDYRVALGGPGVLNPQPLLGICDYIQLGRAEGSVLELAEAVLKGHTAHGGSLIRCADYDPGEEYRIAQSGMYPHAVQLGAKTFQESNLGCNHKCLFCGYTWHRRHCAESGRFHTDGLFTSADNERAMLDLAKTGFADMGHLRITAIDGISERLRRMVNKPIPDSLVSRLVEEMGRIKPRQVKVYNIVGLPTETAEDWKALPEAIAQGDGRCPERYPQASVLVHDTPFRATPCTPMACAPMAYREYRGMLGATRPDLKGNLFYKGRGTFAVEGMGCDSLSSVAMSAMVIRGGRETGDAIRRLALHKGFNSADARTKLATIQSVCDIRRLFDAKDPSELPTSNIRTYARVERLYDRYRWLEPATTGARRRWRSYTSPSAP
jgi:hypothetical protein